MAIPGTFQTYDLATGVKLDVEDIIWLTSPFDVPLQGAMGADGRTALSVDTCFEKKVEWLDEPLLNPRTTAANSIGNTTTATTLVVAAGTGVCFQTGDIIEADGEYMQVTGYGTTADNLFVSRGFAGSTLATIDTGDLVMGVGAALAEGSNPPNARAVDRTDRYNYTQVFGPVAVSVSGSEQAVQKYGLTGTEFDHQVANRTKEQFVTFEQALLYAVINAGTGSGGRTMAGIASWITSNVDSSTTAFTDAALLTLLGECFDAGGTPDRLVVPRVQKQNLSLLNSTDIRYAQDTNIRGQVIDYYDSDTGRLTVVLDRWCKPTDAFVFSREQATICTLRPMQMEMLAKTGDAVNGQVVCEKTLRFRRQSWAGRFSNLTATVA